jgi:cyclophilin family peptidyl-prolyl cis-trans isomerase
MTRRFIAAAIALAVTLTPAAAFAQEGESRVPEAVATAPATPTKLYPILLTDPAQDLENVLLLDLSNGQRVTIRMMPDWAPHHVERIKTLVRQGFYDGVIFHRVIDGFMAQTGDPTGTGQGGSQLPDLEAEFNPLPHVRGTVSMARADSDDSANSQFFIVFYPRFGLDKKYTNFGRVIGNMAAVDAIERGEPPESPTYIVQASLAADNKPQKFPAPAAPQIVAAPVDISIEDLNSSVSD